ncbi:hypothetical protein JTB14_020273 [Gonioctena quinquepunctata]|nr:hypothetical protein JTB14_020273 [Gonioctena quinquepunctata]
MHPKSTSENTRKKKTRNYTLEHIRKDRLEYQKEQISIANKKLANEEEKIKEQARKNDLLEERNRLLKEYLEKR